MRPENNAYIILNFRRFMPQILTKSKLIRFTNLPRKENRTKGLFLHLAYNSQPHFDEEKEAMGDR